MAEGKGRPATNALLNIGIARLEDLTRDTERELRALHGVGPKTNRALRAALAGRGLDFRD